MIQIIQSPFQDSVLLDGNNTRIIVSSDRGADYYFRAKIYINGELHDEQGWSKIDDNIARKDLMNLYHSYFTPEFHDEIFNGITEQVHLIRKVKIEISEYKILNDELMETITLPEFSIIYSDKPFHFDHNQTFVILSEYQSVLNMPNQGKIVIPFYNIGENDNVIIDVIKQDGTITNTYTMPQYEGKKIFLFTFNLANITLTNLDRFLKVRFRKGTLVFEQLIKLFYLPNFQNINEIAFRTLFGFYQFSYFDGELELENSYNSNQYQNEQGQEITAEVTTTGSFTISSGQLLQNENPIIDQICSSLDVKLKYDNKWLDVSGKTQKNLITRSKKHIYTTDLKFSRKKDGWIDNLLAVDIPIMNNFSITVDELVLTPIAKNFVLSHYTGTNHQKIKFKNLGSGLLSLDTASGSIPVVEDEEYDLTDILGFSYISDDLIIIDDSTTTTFEIAVKNDTIWSNYGIMTVIIMKVEEPPEHYPIPIYSDIQILRNSSGIGTHTIVAEWFNNYITHSDNSHSYTVAWTLVGAVPGVTLVNADTAYPTINTTSASPDNFQIQVAATCVGGTGTLILNVKQFSESIKLVKIYDQTGGSTNETWSSPLYRDVIGKITGGTPGETIKIIYAANWHLISNNYVVIVDYGLTSQYSFPYSGAYSVVKTFNSMGEVVIPTVRIQGGFGNFSGHNINFSMTITEASAGMIDPENNIIKIGNLAT